jgi:cobalt/nickel transport system ATP-binding protein
MSNIIELEEVCFGYMQNHVAICDVTLKIGKGEIFTIIGSNGSGKSSLMQLMGGLRFPQKGKITYSGEQLTEERLRDKSFNSFFRTNVGFVFQNPDSQLFCPTVMDELLFAPVQAGMDEKKARERALEIMDMLAISGLADRPTYMLSGGEKKRVAIGSILTTNPDVLLFDEPTSGLDPKTRSFLVEMIFKLNEAGKTIIMTTHFQSRVGILSEEHKLERIGKSTEILNDIEFLIKMNLISDHVHRHGNKIHTHLPTGISHQH